MARTRWIEWHHARAEAIVKSGILLDSLSPYMQVQFGLSVGATGMAVWKRVFENDREG